MERVESLAYCSKCGGLCCINAPGRFSPDDLVDGLRLGTPEGVEKALDSGLAVIYSSFFNAPSSKVAPIFTLGARGKGRPQLSLCHQPARCAHLDKDHCRFALELRPFECAVMVPNEQVARCGLPEGVVMELLWVDHQELLRAVIEERSGQTWRNELLRQAATRWTEDSYAQGAWEMIKALGLAGSSAEADQIVSTWRKTL